jgi:hypothetical protein
MDTCTQDTTLDPIGGSHVLLLSESVQNHRRLHSDNCLALMWYYP